MSAEPIAPRAPDVAPDVAPEVAPDGGPGAAPAARVRGLLFVFLDGVGLGDPDPDVNPFAAADTPFLSDLLGGPLTRERRPQRGEGWAFGSLDATLGYPGLPQSATGQATLLTGLNGAELMDGHYGPWPGPTLQAALERGTLFHHARTPRLANSYPPGFFDALARRRMKLNAPLYAARAARVALPDLDAYRRGEALSADLTGAHLSAREPQLAPIEPDAAGRRLARLAATADFTFFDFWLSDRVGHRGSFAEAVALATRLDRFLAGVWSALDAGTTLLLTSDHGNLEDKRVRTHTRNRVPLLAAGPEAAAFADLEALPQVAAAARRAIGA